ncbi:hypothetical protein, partial [Mesorhizobium sp.]|uniref:hypothetical protein n=1 Tax=Mesorhizobium sp. TaxID=1871066 RepID=UPI0025FBB730
PAPTFTTESPFGFCAKVSQGEKGEPRYPPLHPANKNRRQLASDAGHLGFGIVAPDFSKEKPRLVRSDADPWAGGLGFTSQCRTEPSQATPVNSSDIGA